MSIFSPGLRRRRPQPTQRVAIRLYSKGTEVYRLDLPLEIAEDSLGIYPVLGDSHFALVEPVEWDEIHVQMRYRAPGAELSLEELQDLIDEEKEPVDSRDSEERLEDEAARGAELQLDAKRLEA